MTESGTFILGGIHLKKFVYVLEILEQFWLNFAQTRLLNAPVIQCSL